MTIKKPTPDPAIAWSYAEYFLQAISLLSCALESARFTEFEWEQLSDSLDDDPEGSRAECRTLKSAIEVGEELQSIMGGEDLIHVMAIFEAACCLLGEKYRAAKTEAIQADMKRELAAEMQKAARNLDSKENR